MDDRQAMAAKINALLSKTVENGATEAEAMMAMHKATELMAKYEFNMTSAQIEAQGIDKVEIIWSKNAVHNHCGYQLAASIARLTETRCWLSSNPKRIVFFGMKPDIIFAKWVYETLCNFCSNEADRWWKSPTNYIPSSQITGAERSKLKISFVNGACQRISQKIRDEVEARKKARDNRAAVPGTALVAIDQVKMDAINKALGGVRFNKGRADRKSYDQQASSAGYAAGSKASWTKPVNGTGSTLRLK